MFVVELPQGLFQGLQFTAQPVHHRTSDAHTPKISHNAQEFFMFGPHVEEFEGAQAMLRMIK